MTEDDETTVPLREETLRQVGRYEILREVGRGGTAVVYLAHQTDLDRSVALKELAALRASDPAFVERFLRESRLTGSLNHPNIVTVHEYFEQDGTAFIAMEYFERGSLRPLLSGLTLPQIAGVLDGLLAGLAHAENHGIVHRDLKPENVMVTSAGGVKIADFGMAKMRELGANDRLTDSGTTVGTPAYMAPEQALGQDVGPWTDLYSVGVIAYELLSGRVPFDQSEPPMAIMLRHLNDETPPLLSLNADLDPELCDWVEAMLAKDTRGRPSGAAEAADELEEIMIRLLGPRWRRQSRLLGEATGAAPASILEPTFVTRVLRPTRQFPKSHRRAWIVAVVTAAALLGSVGITAAVALSDGPPSSNGVTEQTTTGGTETPKSQPIAAPSLASIGVSEDGDTVTATMRLTGGKLNPRTIAIDDAEITDGAASFEIRQKGIAAQTSGGSFGPISMRVRKGPGHVLINVRSTTGAFATFRAHRMDAHTVVVTLVKPAPPSSSTSTGTDTQPKDTTTPPPTKPKKPELESG